MSEPERQIMSLLGEAVEHSSPEERAAFLDKACAGDPGRRARVEELLRAHQAAGNFLQGNRLPAEPIAAFDAAATERPGTVIGPYKLLHQIGEGGMGIVWMAEQTQPVQRKVALKVIKPGMDSSQVIARFEAERQALAMMDHVNIARVFDGGATESGRPYFVMELVHGVPITKYCDDNHLTPRERLELFIPVCQAIQHAHQKGIIHRDIKPSNVLITLYDGKPVPKVIDFGVAKATEQKLTEHTLFTQYGTIVGTLEYMSPEQAEMSALGVDTRSDVYSLGVLLYELLTGSTPLSHKRVKEAAYAEIIRIIKEEEPPTPSTRLSDSGEALASISVQRQTAPAKLTKLVRGELDWIVMKALEKDRNRRYETANGFAADVEHYLHDEPVSASPPSAWYRWRKFARRHRGRLLVAGMGLAALLVAVAAIAGSIGWAASDREARDAALDRQVDLTLDEAVSLNGTGRWPEALGILERAEKLLDAAGRSQRPARLAELQRDVAMARRLEDIYNQPATGVPVSGREEDSQFARPDDRSYAEAFVAYGIDLAGMPVVQAAECIRASSIRQELARALDTWSAVRRRAGSKERPDWQQLLEVAKAADPDNWRNPLRTALQRDDRKALQELADTADLRQLPAATLSLLGRTLADYLGAPEQAVTLLRQAQRQYPADLWINSTLGWYFFMVLRPPQYDEAARFYTAGLAVRPSSSFLRNCLGRAFLAKGSLAEAVAEFSKAIELRPDYPAAWFNRGVACACMKKWDSALADCREAIRLKPDHPGAHNSLGMVFRLQGKFAEAEAAFQEAIRLQPDSAAYHNNINVLLRLQGKVAAGVYGDLTGLEILKPEDTVDVQSVPPPPGAVVLFDGKSLDNWAKASGGPATWKLLPNGIMEVSGGNIVTKQKFDGAFKVHVEFRVPYLPKAKGQARGNSGVYLQGRYEVQILDSYGLKSTDKDCGSLFEIAPPRVNACKAPTFWQSYDIDFQSPTCAGGKKTVPAVITVYHNNLKVHDNVTIPRANTSGGLGGDPCAPGPIMLQDHGNPVQYRNIWLVPWPQESR
jgi:eukaryotic-like serine/threonine-protein kinase